MLGELFARDHKDGVYKITDPWPVQDIVYVAIVGTIMLAALLEWFLWLAAFEYCLVKVFQKAETISIRILAVIMMVLFFCFRAIFLPIMVVTLPLPPQIVVYFPHNMVNVLQWFAFWSFSGLLIIPWLMCVFQLVTHSVGRTKRIKHVLDESSAPKVVIVMPCYKEIPDILLRTIDSLVDCEYPPSCLHIFLSFDGEEEDELYLNTIEKIGVPLTLDSYPKSIDVTYRSCRITVSRFKHGGKRHTQKATFRLIDKIYTEYLKRNDNLFILFIDSDCILDKVCIQNFMYEMELKPGSKQNMLAMTGVITSTTEKNSFLTVLQDMEYIHGQLFERSVESGCGAVTCLPGALTMLRFSAFRKMAKYYFADKAEQCEDLFDYGKCHLGEDRWLTHLFMIGAQERYQIQMNTGAFCKTEAVQSFRSLLKQRRRWFLGFITNEVCMLTDIRLWKRYTFLCIIRFANNTIRTTALLFFIMVISLITTSQKIKNLPVGFIGVSLGLNWLLMVYFSARLGRFKILMYPLMFVVNPFFNWMYMVYGIFTAGQRTWGGPRADASGADENQTAAEAIEKAEEQGDDLNVVPETFKPAAEIQRQKSKKGGKAPQLSLQPSDHLEGRFAAPQRLPGGWYQQANDSGLTIPDLGPRDPNAPRIPLHPRASWDSTITATSAGNSVYIPRRVESVMDPEGLTQYQQAQAAQRPAGGAFYETDNTDYASMGKAGFNDSLESVDADSVYSNPYGYAGYGKEATVTNTMELSSPRNPHARIPSNNSMRSPGSPLIAEVSQSEDPLSVPGISHNANNSYSSRNGRSPLARTSFMRTGEEEAGIELQQAQGLMDPRARSVSPGPALMIPPPQPPAEDAGHERQDSGEGERQRRRLQKQPKRYSDA
ncbi:glycosyltransferase family 2 protein [Aplosporella prunicola CBS 121167]|uniref:chitin synthase n=1 Tax=Aplosporella prunicola CBS 121167 TaxID=1176127 RepID=A0A6A6AYH9_9PEZI|nr:glycosyltransferase family 2 protein [Aplosporella prunicola CBS 121167]KAF2136666.1 glycosyltransferase family 2 protein [Aplosporella prunicola CBS 121167]